MYRCEYCKKVVPPNTPANHVVAEFRETVYPARAKANEVRAGRKTKPRHDPGGAGREIVREVKLCPSCIKALDERAEEQAEAA